MVRVREVRVRVGQGLVPMRMRMAASDGTLRMLVLVVHVMFVLMVVLLGNVRVRDRKSTRLNSSH